jgi:hypothetical protein
MPHVGATGIGGDPDPGPTLPVIGITDVRVIDHVAVVQEGLVAVLNRQAIADADADGVVLQRRAIGCADRGIPNRGHAAGRAQRHEGEEGQGR